MSDDGKHLGSLVNEPETVKQLLQGELQAEGGNIINPLKIIDEAQKLGHPESVVLVEVMKGKQTSKEIADTTDITAEEAGNALAELRLGGYLNETKTDGGKEYTISTTWEQSEFPSGPVIPLVYQFNLLSDRSRMEALKEAIDNVVNEGDVVADLGAGAGILSFLAAQQAEKVYAVEIDKEIHGRGKELIANQNIDNVEYIHGDARNEGLPEQVDVVICEMLDTGLAAELQVPVMNRVVKTLLKDSGETIPYRSKSTARLVQTDYTFFGGEFRLPHFEAYGSRESTVLSEEETYHDITFEDRNDLFVSESVTLTATSAGTINGVQLNTYVQFSKDSHETTGSSWLNPPLTLPIDRDVDVEPGDQLEIVLDYELGGGLNKINYRVSESNK